MSKVWKLSLMLALSPSVWAQEALEDENLLQDPSDTLNIPEPTKKDLPEDVQKLEEKVYKELSPITSFEEKAGDPGEGLPPDEKFSRIPLRPPMNDKSWEKWAGKMLQKAYVIRSKDTLWGTSQVLFGNPYVWPKVWHLNARLQNPHEIFPGMILQFQPGNPFSAPVLSLKGPYTPEERLPLVPVTRELSFLEMIARQLRLQAQSGEPPFKFFLYDRLPAIVGRIEFPKDYEGMFLGVGSEIPMRVKDGTYRVIRAESVSKKRLEAHRVQWVGEVEVSGGRGRLTRSFTEVSAGDLLVTQEFQLDPIKVHEGSLSYALQKRTSFIELEEGSAEIFSENKTVGLRLPDSDESPGPGALLGVRDAQGLKVGQLLIIHKDGPFATAWVIHSKRELSEQDSIF